MDGQTDLAFRGAMGAFATGVAVVSARFGDRVAGVTVNSLTSVSLSPRLLLWCLGAGSERYDIFAAAEAWGVTVLSADDEALARRYASAGGWTVAAEERFELEGAPVLKEGLAHFSCRTFERASLGDHLVMVGEVLALRERSGAGLSFFRGRYGRIAEPGSV